MKIVIFTGNALRHKYIANLLTRETDEALIVSECKPHDSGGTKNVELSPLEKHFALRAETEMKFFEDSIAFEASTIPILHKEVNLPFIYESIKTYKPDVGFVFGSYIIKEPLLSLIPSGKFINLHLGLSPYYRGSGTNFWPLANGEPQYVGATLLHIDPGIDTGDIIAHVRPDIEKDDTVHTLGCKTIIKSGKALVTILRALNQKRTLPRTSQWRNVHEKYYKKADFTEATLKQYYQNLENGMLRDYTEETIKIPRLIPLNI